MKQVISQICCSLTVCGLISLGMMETQPLKAQTVELNQDQSLPESSGSEIEENTELNEDLSFPETNQPENEENTGELNISPEIIEESPVLQRWLEEIPDISHDIRHDPSFRTRVRFGYSQFTETDNRGGFHGGVEDLFLGQTGFTVSAEYQQTFDGDQYRTWGGDLRYYLFPLGSYVNIAPLIGYRNIETEGYATDGVNLGAKLMLALSPKGGADLSVSQSFVSPGSSDEVGITSFSFGYALTQNLRLSTDIQKQNSRSDEDLRFGFTLEWMP